MAGVVIGSLTTGVTWAATSGSPKAVKACVNSHGVLALLSKGKCPRGYGGTTLARQGVRGATGRTGPSNGYSLSLSDPKANGTEKLTVPAGKYIITWDDEDSAEVDDGPATGSYNSYSYCDLVDATDSSSSKPVGSQIVDVGALVPAGDGEFERVGRPASSFGVKFGRTVKLAVDCSPVSIIDGDGNPPAASTHTYARYAATDITAVAVGTLHG